MEASRLVVRARFGRCVLFALLLLGVIGSGILLAVLPPRENRPLDAMPLFMALRYALSLLIILSGLVGTVTLIYTVARPLVILYPDHLIYPRHQTAISYADISELEASVGDGLLALRLLDVRVPGWPQYLRRTRYAEGEDLSQVYYTLDLTLASLADFEAARAYLAERIPLYRPLA